MCCVSHTHTHTHTHTETHTHTHTHKINHGKQISIINKGFKGRRTRRPLKVFVMEQDVGTQVLNTGRQRLPDGNFFLLNDCLISLKLIKVLNKFSHYLSFLMLFRFFFT